MGKPDSGKSPHPSYFSSGIQDSGRRVLGIDSNFSKAVQIYGLKNESIKLSSFKVGKRKIWFLKHLKPMMLTFGIMCFLFLLDSLVFSVFDPANVLVLQKVNSFFYFLIRRQLQLVKETKKDTDIEDGIILASLRWHFYA